MEGDSDSDSVDGSDAWWPSAVLDLGAIAAKQEREYHETIESVGRWAASIPSAT